MRIFRKHRKALKFALFLLLPFLAYGLIKLALWYGAKMNIENFSRQSAGFIDLKYTTISSSLKGSVSVNGLTVFIPMIKESIHIKSIRLSADNVINLLRLSYKFKADEIPNSLSLVIEELKVDLNSKLFNTPKETKQTPLERFSTLACGDIERFDETALKAMGYSDIISDFNISYVYDKSSKTLNFSLYENIDRFFSVEFNAQLKNVSKIPDSTELVMAMSAADLPQSLVRLGKIKLTINDDSFISRKVNFCASNNNSNQKNYIDKHVKMANNYLQQMGIKLHQNLIDAYQKSLTHPGNVIISMDFSDVTNPAELSEFLINDIISQLSTELFVNNKAITPILIQIDQQQLNSSTGSQSKEIKIHDANVKAKVLKKYHLQNKNNLSQYHKHMVKVRTTLGKTYEGQLNIKSPNKYEIIVRTRGGEIGYFVKNNEIQTIEVFY